MKTLLFILGTRPEAIKLSPVILHFQKLPAEFLVCVCTTGQHREMARQALAVFGIVPDIDLDLMLPGQTLFQSTSRILSALEGVFFSLQPDLVLVQGDTTTTLCGALGAFYAGVPVAHIEAGLRTWDLARPFPEEANRQLACKLANLHLAATPWAAENLRREGVPESTISVTGNTGIDALLLTMQSLPAFDWPFLDASKRLILVTGHRRENFGDGLERLCRALARLAARPDVELVYPVHPNPKVRGPVEELLRGKTNVHLIAPQDYLPFLDLMHRSFFIVTDSGGVQEEGPSLGKPILVTREVTERPEAVAAGTVRLVGTDEEKIVHEASLLLDDPVEYERRSHIHNPYGDGRACPRIETAVRAYFESR
ncbi:non-hydrolyzing UDP-N-acetylglucosamine 2-epimerase [Bryobacter aggregatus]|uniref:non-hydrolyzing UDP-N-acetylglucosamine 2-epimerase n=1 Tax=Bryobacter aggregatus TaxID=360054 RepID=UPI0004E13BEF|nr:UDP-N-acetylglucosamine 2-epimerase (non-hydrolyzing) [Bryobacter aggregatus]